MKIIKISKVERSVEGFVIQLTPEDLSGPNCNAIKVIKKLQPESAKVSSINTEEDITDLFNPNKYDMEYCGKRPTVIAQINNISNHKPLAVKVLKFCCGCSLREAKNCIDENPDTVTFRAPKDTVEEWIEHVQRDRNGIISIHIISEDHYGE